MGMMQEFKEFAVKGNAIDLAVGVIIGGAFGKIIDSIVNDLVMPIVSFLFGGKFDFTNLFVVLGKAPENMPATYDALKKAGVPIFAYGSFLTILINFVLMAFAIFMLVKALNKWKGKLDAPAPAPAGPPAEQVLLGEIRDLLKRRPA